MPLERFGETPIIAVYGERAYDAARGSGLRDYEPILLPVERDPDVPFDFADLPFELRSRPVVIWPAPGAAGLALARTDAEALARGVASAVDIVVPPEGLDDGFELGDELPDWVERDDLCAAADVALDEALARALPAPFGGRAVAPLPGPVNTGAMFAAARELLARYLAEPRAVIDAIVLWCLHAWRVHAEGDQSTGVSPRLILQATDARADHARALRLIAWLTPAPRIVSRAVAMHLLPAIEDERPTLLFDDVAGGILFRREMRALIAAGATRDNTFLVGAHGRRRSPWLECFAPAAVATAFRVPQDMRARAIVASMSPAPAGEARAQLDPGNPPDEVCALRAQMQAFAAEMSDKNDPSAAMPRGLGAQARENWRPLFAAANAIGAKALQCAIDAALGLADAEPAPASNLALLRDIRELAPVDAGTRIPTAQLIEKLCADPERPWASARRGGRKLDARDLAERLDGFGVKPRLIRMPGDEIARGYHGEELLEAFARYLNDPTARERMTRAGDDVTNEAHVTAA